MYPQTCIPMASTNNEDTPATGHHNIVSQHAPHDPALRSITVADTETANSNASRLRKTISHLHPRKDHGKRPPPGTRKDGIGNSLASDLAKL
jgi:hypothetical protein